ncbi:MAG: ribonuclease domain-containing protein [Janthinobacterium lividum]
MSGRAPASRSARTAAVVAVVLVLALVAVLVGLVGSGGSDAVPAASTSSSPKAARPGSPGARTSPSAARPSAGRDPQSGLRVVALGELPREARATVALIDRGGPFPYSQDGVTFGNYEKVLPDHPRGWYREYTVRTPGERDRGPRRIVTGDHDAQLFYTGDHYATFVRVSP